MDEREFASSVCYMDYDDYPLDTANQRLCSECRAMILAFERCISQSEKQAVQDPPFYARRGPFDDSIIFGCPLCSIAGNCKIFHEVSAPLLEFMTDPETYPVFIEYRRQSWGSSGQGQTLELLLRFKDIDFERYPPPAPFLIKFALLPAEGKSVQRRIMESIADGPRNSQYQQRLPWEFNIFGAGCQHRSAMDG